jgi:hypothetical protein
VLWRLWSLLSGLPLGVLAILGWVPDAGLTQLAWGAGAGALCLLGVVSLLARLRDDEPERGRHLAVGASAAWLALPACGAVLLGFAPGGQLLLALVVLGLALSLAAAIRAIGPAGGILRWALRAVMAALVGTLGFVALAAIVASVGGGPPPIPEAWSNLIFGLDARVVTAPLPDCGTEIRRAEVVLARGANPVLAPGGRMLWFDAWPDERGEDGETARAGRQIHRLDRDTGETTCWTCAEPGNNVRPSIGANGASLVFSTDRNASWLHPGDTDIHIVSTRAGSQIPSSHRLTFSTAPEDHGVLGPASNLVAWSRLQGGRYQVVAAPIRSGHGGILLGTPGVLASGGASWMAPVAWSPDARALVIVQGNPFAPLRGFVLDPATGARSALGDQLAVAASFDVDGGWLAYGVGHGLHSAGALPGFLGFALASWARTVGIADPVLGGTGVDSGPTPAAGAALDLPEEVASWGEPTGVALEPDGRGLLLGQRRRIGEGVEERILELALECPPRAQPAP